MEMRFKMTSGVGYLLSNAKNSSNYNGVRYSFKGDLNQMSIAAAVASIFEIDVIIDGGIPFVKSKDDFDKVVKHLIDQKLEGWHNYVTYEKYCELKGEYYLNGSQGETKEEIIKAANELGIAINVTEMKTPFVTSKEQYNSIIDFIKNNFKLKL